MSRPSGQGTVYKEAVPGRNTRWRAEKIVRLPDGSRKRIIVRGRTQGEALANLAAKERALENAHPDAEKLTARAFLKRWLEHQRGRVKPSTLAEYERVCDYAIDAFGHIPLARVRPTHVQMAIDAAVARKNLGTAEAIRRYMKQAFRQAERWELITRNPVANLPVVRRPEPTRRAWQPHEAQRFLEAVREHLHPGYYAIFYAALLTGMRRGELLALKWADVTPTGVTVRATASRHAEGGIGTPKTSKSLRRIPITKEAYETLAACREKLPASEWAFPNNQGGRIGERNLLRAFVRGIELTAKPDADPPLKAVPSMRLHDLRRTTASWWAAAGVPPKVIQQLLGHSTPRLALEVYTDVLEGQVDSAALDPSKWVGGGKIGGDAG